jgi:hypothetical protein
LGAHLSAWHDNEDGGCVIPLTLLARADEVIEQEAMSACVKVCGCRPHEGGAARTGAGVRKPPMEETAGGVARWRVRRYGDLTAVVPECEYNFCDMARTLRIGENTFRRPCNFKELRVVKRAHITTFALCA